VVAGTSVGRGDGGVKVKGEVHALTSNPSHPSNPFYIFKMVREGW
jgi:hypothetical protein